MPGRFLSDQYLKSVPDLDERQAIYKEFATTAAKLHAVKPSDTPGLEALGRGGGYLARQVKTWSAQYRKSIDAAPDLTNPSMELLVDNLPMQVCVPRVITSSAEMPRVSHRD